MSWLVLRGVVLGWAAWWCAKAPARELAQPITLEDIGLMFFGWMIVIGYVFLFG